MEMTGAHEAQRGGFAPLPSGFRRLTPGLLRADRAAEAFDGLPDGVATPGQLLAAFKAAAPRLGLSARLVHAVDWLFRFTQPQDWGRGGRPIVWPSSLMQQEALSLSASRVKSVNRALIETGLVTMRDSPNGKRYGVRDREGRITEAYGFDLSPLAARHAEFLRLAAEARAERMEVGRLRRRVTIARKGIAQILETAAEHGHAGEEWTRLRGETQSLVKTLRLIERPEDLALGVASLERRQSEARARLEMLLKVVDSDPKGPENRPHITSTNDLDNPRDTVMASEGCKSTPGERVPDRETPAVTRERQSAGQGAAGGRPDRAERTDAGTVMRLSADELLRLAPRLRPFLRTGSPAWPDLVEAAEWLRGELGVSKSLWGEACLTMGREQAAIAIGIVSAKPEEHFRTTPGGYFHGMVMKAKAGTLNLARTVWGLRDGGRRRPGAATPRPGTNRGRPWSGHA